MSIQINVKKTGEGSFTDRREDIEWETVEIRQYLTNQADTALFEVHQDGSKTYIPELEDEVQFESDGDRIFGGYVVRVENRILPGNVLAYRVELKDYQHLLDRKLVNKTYENMTEAEIIEDIFDTYVTGLTYTAVDGASTVDSITFINQYPSKCLQKLADIFSKDYYIDYQKDLHYFSKEANSAPFTITDTNGNLITPSLLIFEDQGQIKNSIVVEGGQELSDNEHYDDYEADGVQHTFKLTYKYKNIAGTIDTGGGPVALSIGSDGLHDFTDGYDALYNYAQDSLRFDPLSPPASGAVIEAGGYYYFDITTRVRELSSISTYGEREFRISAPSIDSRDLAKERAKAEISAYSSPVEEGVFETYTAGLRSGQRITINSAIRGKSSSLLIKQVRTNMETPTRFVHTVQVISYKTFDVMDLLAKIFEKEEVNQGETVTRSADLIVLNHEVTRTIYERNFEPTWLAYDPLYYPSDYALDDNRQLWSSGDCVISD